MNLLIFSDYILDITEEIGNFNYITQCIKNNDKPEYIIVDNPAKMLISENIDINERKYTSNSISQDFQRNKINDLNKKGMFNEVTFQQTDTGLDNSYITIKKKSNYNLR